MQVAKTIHVQCTNPACPTPADTDVPLELAAPNVAAVPRLICLTCTHECMVVEEIPLTSDRATLASARPPMRPAVPARPDAGGELNRA